jgi:hypothetical protein
MDELRNRAQRLLDDPPVAPTPIADLRRRAHRRRTRRAAAAGVVVVGASALVFAAARATSTSPRVQVAPTTVASTLPPVTTPPVAIGAPASFVSTRGEPQTPNLTVAVSDTLTAKILKTLVSVPTGFDVTGTAIAPNGDIWVTLDKGPKMLGHVANGNPQPHTCASTVLDIDPRTGTSKTVLRGGDDELLTDAQPSPTGDRVAYLHSGCATDAFGPTLQIRDLGTGAVLSIGAGLERCHFLADPRWTPHGRSLALRYDKSPGPPDPGTGGLCGQSAPGELLVVSAEQSQPGLGGPSAPAASGCAIDAVAVTSTGYAAVEHCGLAHPDFPEQLFIDGAVRLVRYDGSLRVVSRTPLGQCEDGASIAGDRRSPTVVVSTYQFCAAAGQAQPFTKVFVDTGRGPARQIASLPGGSTEVDDLSF